MIISDERTLKHVSLLLGADRVPGWSAAERRLAAAAVSAGAGSAGAGPAAIGEIRAKIAAGQDPLGEAFCRLRPPAQRRGSGQTFTPRAVVDSMVGWAGRATVPARVVDPGSGSARFLVAAGRRWPGATLTGVETDPVAALIGRATLAAAGMAARANVTLTDYRSLRLAPARGPTLFLGNPPYVRHHQIPARWKDWLRVTAAGLGLAASGLSGLHVHFFLAIARHAVPGDAGVLVTAAEWLDVNYGALVRSLLLGPLGGQAIHLLDPAARAFADAAATAAIACFLPGTRPASLRLRHVAAPADLGELSGGVTIPAGILRDAPRWGPLVATPPCGGGVTGRSRAAGWPGGGARPPSGYVELGELCRVHRGQVTGANQVWITSADGGGLPRRWLVPAVTRASELLAAGEALATTRSLRRVIDLPADLSDLAPADLALVTVFLERAREAGAADSYVARHRRPWWRVRMATPAPILATYMARRPPAFVRNLAGAGHVNVAHGIYPRQPMPPAALDGLAAFLRASVTPGQGRTYSGGLTKFEPREMERLPVPPPDMLPGYPRRPFISSRGTTSATASPHTGWPSPTGSGKGRRS